MSTPYLSVVVPYFERQDQLERLLVGLDQQSLPAEKFELVVADDGSRRPPAIGPRPFHTTVVRQPDRGFRLAEARNLGASVAQGTVIAFVDQDCVPGPHYLRLVHQAAEDPWTLVVGHRLHADLTGWSAASTAAWLAGHGPAPPLLSEPQWLLDGYERTQALTRPDEHSYQLVIGAALSLRRELLAHLGGFDPAFRAYGGEDWELAHRAYVAGADLRWLSDAVVWHDGPDLAGRSLDMAGTKNAETLTLARTVPDPDLRGTRLLWRIPRIVVRLRVGRQPLAALVAATESLLAGADAQLWVPATGAGAELARVLEDPRVHVGQPPAEVTARCDYLVRCDPVVLQGATLHDLEVSTPVARPGFEMVSSRDHHRRRRGHPRPPAGRWPSGVTVTPVPSTLQLERHWQDMRLQTDARRRDDLSGDPPRPTTRP